MGDLTDVEVRTKGVLVTHEIDSSEFPETVMESLPEMPFKIPEEEYKKRR